MSISLICNDKRIDLSVKRLDRMMSGDKQKAVYMGLWDKIKDLFRSEKKQDALNELYKLLYSDSESGAELSQLCAFQRLKDMADPAYQYLFKLETLSNELHFKIGDATIARQSLDEVLQIHVYLSLLSTQQLNENIYVKSAFQAALTNRLREESATAGVMQLFKDLPRNHYKFDHFEFKTQDGIAKEDKEAALTQFLEKLTEAQKQSLNVVGSQIGSIEIKNAFSIMNPKHAIIGNPSVSYEFGLDDVNSTVWVNTTIKQNHEIDYFHVLREGWGLQQAEYPQLGLQALLSIDANGLVECIDFHCASHVDGLASSSLATTEPCIYSSLTYLRDFVEEINIAWALFTKNNPEITYDQTAQRNFIRIQLEQQIQRLTYQQQQQVLTHLEEAFGNRLRGIVDFVAEKVCFTDDYQLISHIAKYNSVLEEIMLALSIRIKNKEASIKSPLMISEISQLYPEEKLAFELIGIRPSFLNV